MDWGMPREGFVEVDGAKADAIGIARQSIHPNGTERFFDDKNTEDMLGARAELAFSQVTGLPMDEGLHADGDKGIDFMVPFGNSTELVSLDTKGAVTPIHLFVKEHEIERCADLLVLAGVDGDRVWFLGWEHKMVMARMPIKSFNKRGAPISNYHRIFSLLRPMDHLFELIRMGQRAIEDERYQKAMAVAVENLKTVRR